MRTKVINGLKKIKQQEQEFSKAEGEELYALGDADREERRSSDAKVAESEYAKPPTFFDQIATSVKCVFLGFVIATAIAVPIGVLCGLNRVFMASMTPLISLFKPVSPIVWLPIVFIIVGGFIEVPEDAWLPPSVSQFGNYRCALFAMADAGQHGARSCLDRPRPYECCPCAYGLASGAGS